METEAKLAFKDKDSLYGFSTADCFRKFCADTDEHSPVLLENSYLDTPDHVISGCGGMIRVRHYKGSNEDRFEFTVKYGGSVSGAVHQRYEWNVESSSGNFSVSEFKRLVPVEDDSADVLAQALDGIRDDDLKVICSNSFYRTVIRLAYGRSRIEACFDSGIIKSADGIRTDEICELELELTDGFEDDLRNITDLFIAQAGCVPFEDTKYRRTLAMGTGN